MMSPGTFFFAGGGTGGHIYPALAVAEQLIRLRPDAEIHFFCSSRDIDARILGKTGFPYTRLPAKGFCLRPRGLAEFVISFMKSCRRAREILAGNTNAVVVGTGGFIAAPVCWSARKLKLPIVLLNVDILPGRANKLLARFAEKIFVQFEETAQYFGETAETVSVVGCPLRSDFANPDAQRTIKQLGLDKTKRTLVVTGASSGSRSINRTVCSLLPKLDLFSDKWQVVHIAGAADFDFVSQHYGRARINSKVLDYYDDMAGLLCAADLVIGRSGAVSVAEYAAAAVPSICMPYPHHRDRHQYLNAGKLVEAGAAIIVDDLPDERDRTGWLWEELEELLKDESKRREMAQACRQQAGRLDAAFKIAEQLLDIAARS